MSESARRFFLEVLFWVLACSTLTIFLGFLWDDKPVMIVATLFALASLFGGAVLAHMDND